MNKSKPSFEMRYLSPSQQAHVTADEHKARFYWHEAMENGRHAYRLRRIQQARLYFGAAFETALIRIRHPDNNGDWDGINILHLVSATRQLADVLCELKDFDGAEKYLSLTHSCLLVHVNDDNFNGDIRGECIVLVDEFMNRLIRLLERRNNVEVSEMQIEREGKMAQVQFAH